MGFIVTQATQLAQFLQDNEYEIATANKNEEKVKFLVTRVFRALNSGNFVFSRFLQFKFEQNL